MEDKLDYERLKRMIEGTGVMSLVATNFPPKTALEPVIHHCDGPYKWESIQEGGLKAVHIWTARLAERIAEKEHRGCLWIIRFEETGWRVGLLCKEFRIKGVSFSSEWWDKPLPGTNGRGVAPLLTRAAIDYSFPGSLPELLVFKD